MSPGPSSYPPLQVPQRPPRNPKTGKQSSAAQAPSILPRPTPEGRVHPFLVMGTLRHPGAVPCTTRRCTAPRHRPDRNGPQSSVAWEGSQAPQIPHVPFPRTTPTGLGASDLSSEVLAPPRGRGEDLDPEARSWGEGPPAPQSPPSGPSPQRERGR